jgi:hypothetical protein
MAPDLVVVRFPDGSKEFRYPGKMLEVDDVLWHVTRAIASSA